MSCFVVFEPQINMNIVFTCHSCGFVSVSGFLATTAPFQSRSARVIFRIRSIFNPVVLMLFSTCPGSCSLSIVPVTDMTEACYTDRHIW